MSVSQKADVDTRVFPDVAGLSRAASEETLRLANAAVARKGRFDLALSGGKTPRRLYEVWAEEYAGQFPWPRMHFFWGDERYVPHDHPDSNYRMAREALLDRVTVPASNVHPMPTDSPRPEDAAQTYEATLRAHFGNEPDFDLVLLGIGPEGHTASLFPGSSALEERQHWVLAVQAPAEPPVRLTLTLPVLNRARNVFFLVAGTDKRDIVKILLSKPAPELTKYPAALIHPVGKLTWFLDKAARG
jgi:6-phosphogluconolactonase